MIAVAVAGCGRAKTADVVNGKQLFTQRCGSCHTLKRAGTGGTIGPNLDNAFGTARRDGLGASTIGGVVRGQISHPRRGSQMPPRLVRGQDARDVAAYVAMAAGAAGQDTGALASVGLASARTGRQIFTAAGCGACHTLADAGSKASVGPPLDNLAGVAGARVPGRDAKRYVREAIVDPRVYIVNGFPPNVMPTDFARRLERQQVDALVKYLLRPRG